MNDTDIDEVLTRHGEAWRDANSARPGVDWSELTEPRLRHTRRWLAGGAATAVAAGAAVVAVLLSGGSGVIGHSGPATAAALRGAPRTFTTIGPSRVFVVNGNEASGTAPFGHRLRSLAVGPDGRSGFFAVKQRGCQTAIHTLKRASLVNPLRYRETYTVPGVAARTPMALSPDGTKLAYALVRRPGSGGGCTVANALVVVDLTTHTRHTFTGSSAAVTDLFWAGDSRHLLFSGGPSVVGTGDYSTRDLDTQTATRSLVGEAAPPVLDPSDAGTAGLVFPWHGQLVTIVGGAMYMLDGRGGLGPVVATQFPTERIESVSSDLSGDHLLISTYAGMVKYYESGSTTPIPRPQYNVYRWDNGYLTEVDAGTANYRQAGW